MTSFELGYKAYLEGHQQDENPFDKDLDGYSHRAWDRGWLKAKKDRKS